MPKDQGVLMALDVSVQRAVKAGRWCDVLRKFGITSSEVERQFTEDTWKQLAKVHGIRAPSPETVAVLVGLMEAEERSEQ